jgi:glycosyltransferase involved in cell wall biosynthesis
LGNIIAFVIKSYAEDLIGGGETLVREFSRRLKENGYTVEILTTTLRDYRDERAVYPAGTSYVHDVLVRRFPVQRSSGILQRQPQDGDHNSLALVRSERWFRKDVHSPALYHYLKTHGRSYYLTIILDYFPGLSLYATMANSGRTAIYPQLHNEPIAYLPLVRYLLDSADGIMFNCVPERDFARYNLGIRNPRTAIVGVGVEADSVGQADRFRQKYGITEPFLLYVGRLDHAKNVPTLVRHFLSYKERFSRCDLKLVLMGQGHLNLPSDPDIVVVGQGSDQDKYDAMTAALAVCQPSLLESLSIVSLEALGQGTPILVNGYNEVTRYHCVRGNCGLYFYGQDDFALALELLYTRPRLRERLGQCGREYARQYSWDVVTQRLLDAIERFANG